MNAYSNAQDLKCILYLFQEKYNTKKSVDALSFSNVSEFPFLRISSTNYV